MRSKTCLLKKATFIEILATVMQKSYIVLLIGHSSQSKKSGYFQLRRLGLIQAFEEFREDRRDLSWISKLIKASSELS